MPRGYLRQLRLRSSTSALGRGVTMDTIDFHGSVCASSNSGLGGGTMKVTGSDSSVMRQIRKW